MLRIQEFTIGGTLETSGNLASTAKFSREVTLPFHGDLTKKLMGLEDQKTSDSLRLRFKLHQIIRGPKIPSLDCRSFGRLTIVAKFVHIAGEPRPQNTYKIYKQKMLSPQP